MVSPISSLVRLGTFLILIGTAIHFLPAQVLEPEPTTNQTETTFRQVVEPPPSTPADLADRVLTQQALRAYLQLQEQMHTALLAIQKGREDAQAAADRNKEAVSERLTTIESTLVTQRAQESAATENSTRLVLIMAGVLAGLGFLAVIIVSSLQLRAMSRLAQVARSIPPAPAPAALPALVGHEDRLLPANEAEQSTARLRATVQTLQDRIHELEQLTTGNGSKVAPPSKSVRPLPEPALANLDTEQAGRISLLLGKGQSLLHLNEAADALKCFDQVLALDPRNTEALIKKGTSLERLKRLEAAIECYDQAISINDAMTLAYLYKGGVYNQLERFNEALQCYEHALRTQQKDQLSPAG